MYRSEVKTTSNNNNKEDIIETKVEDKSECKEPLIEG